MLRDRTRLDAAAARVHSPPPPAIARMPYFALGIVRMARAYARATSAYSLEPHPRAVIMAIGVPRSRHRHAGEHRDPLVLLLATSPTARGASPRLVLHGPRASACAPDAVDNDPDRGRASPRSSAKQHAELDPRSRCTSAMSVRLVCSFLLVVVPVRNTRAASRPFTPAGDERSGRPQMSSRAALLRRRSSMARRPRRVVPPPDDARQASCEFPGCFAQRPGTRAQGTRLHARSPVVLRLRWQDLPVIG